MSKEKKIGGGLIFAERDPRNFSYANIFGAAKLEDLPEGNFYVSEPLEIKDQKDSDMCTAYASAAVSEDQELIPLCPHFSFYAIKQKIMKDPGSWGASLLDACKAAQKIGFLEKQYCPFCSQNIEPTREEVLNPANWDTDAEVVAQDHAKGAYFEVDGPYDLFDNIRSALYKNRAEFRSVFLGCYWRRSWTLAEKGQVKEQLEQYDTVSGGFFGHAFKIYGQKVIDGQLYLVAQLSNGEGIGDKGIYSFPREVVNREFTFGSFTFRDMPKNKADYHNYYKISVDDPFWKAFLKVNWTILKDIFKRIFSV